jgi:hypothetical protein
MLSSIPTIHWTSFFLATLIASPKLLLHVWVGAQMAELADRGDKMDTKTKIISYTSIAIGSILGAVTGWWIYSRTMRRAAELEELEREESGGTLADEYEDDPDLAEAADILREEEDDISLRDAWGDDDYEDDDDEGSDTPTPSTTDLEAINQNKI